MDAVTIDSIGFIDMTISMGSYGQVLLWSPCAKNYTRFCITLPLKRAFYRAENTSKKERVEKQKTADSIAAGLNMALVNYYFRNKDKLYQIVMQGAKQEIP
jgi:hypothetical protein